MLSLIRGKYHIEGDTKVIITELPVKSWTDKYKNFWKVCLLKLEKIPKKTQCLRNYNSYCSDTKVHFELVFPEKNLFL